MSTRAKNRYHQTGNEIGPEEKGDKSTGIHPEFDLRTDVYKLFGVDVTQIPGLEENALPPFSEVGRDMSRWPTAAHFISWLALCPDNYISGGKLLWRGARRVKNRALAISVWQPTPSTIAPRP